MLGLSNTPYSRPSLGLGTGITAPPPRAPSPTPSTAETFVGPPAPPTPDPVQQAAIRRNTLRMALKIARRRNKKTQYDGMVTTDDLRAAQDELRKRGLPVTDDTGYEPFMRPGVGIALPIRDFTRAALRPSLQPVRYRQPAPSQPFAPSQSPYL